MPSRDTVLSCWLFVALVGALAAGCTPPPETHVQRPVDEAQAASELAVSYTPAPEALDPKDPPLGMKFVRLPKGTFYMGWDGEHRGVKTEIKDDFEIAVHPVTQGQWEAIMGNNPNWFSRNGQGKAEVERISDEELKQFPVEMVSWSDTQEFIRRLNEREHGSGHFYRLPTEAEWEYACRGGANSEEECSYHFYLDKPTNELTWEQANFFGRDPQGKTIVSWECLHRTSKIGSDPPNKLGIYDMHGNVSQWSADPVVVDESERLQRAPWDVPNGPARWVRGGCYSSPAPYSRAGHRIWATENVRAPSIGFRLVRVRTRRGDSYKVPPHGQSNTVGAHLGMTGSFR